MTDAPEHDVARDSNRLLWRPADPRPHIESLFLKVNLTEARQALWLQFGARTPQPSVDEPHAHVMAARFHVDAPNRNCAIKQRYAPDEAAGGPVGLALRFGDCVLEEGHTAGRVARNGHDIAWELHHRPDGRSLQHYDYDRLYALPFPRTKATTPVLSSRFRGWVEVDGERLEVNDAPGMQGHNWGVEYAWRWAWAHGNTLEGRRGPALFEALTGQIRLGATTSPWIGTAVLESEGERLRFDTLRHPLALRSQPGGTHWHLLARDRQHRLTVQIEAPAAHFLGVTYLNPDGRLVRCANCSVASAELRLFARQGRRWVERDHLVSRHGAALELAGPELAPGLRLHLP